MARYAALIEDIVNGSNDHLSVEQVYLRLKEKEPKVVLATVYNNLNRLMEEGKIRKVAVAGYADRYDKMERHDHLVCKQCGALQDIYLKDLTSQLRKQIGEEISSYDLKVSYICPSCRKKNDKHVV